MWHPFWKKKTVQKTSSSYQSDVTIKFSSSIQSIFRPPHLQIEAANLSKLGFFWFVVRDFLLGILILCILSFLRLQGSGFPCLRKMIEMLQPQKRWFQPQKLSKKQDFTRQTLPKWPFFWLEKTFFWTKNKGQMASRHIYIYNYSFIYSY